MGILELIGILICLGLIFLFAAVLFVVVTSDLFPVIVTLPGEESFVSPATGERVKFPSILKDDASLDLSVVVPAYNEENRLPKMLDEAIEYLESRKTLKYEIIVVDDGSEDRTTEVALTYGSRLGSEKFRVLTLKKNRGKGGAVRMGVLRSRGSLVLFADADGATKFSDLEKLEQIKDTEDGGGDFVVCGSRAHLEKESIATRSALRTILMKGFHFCVRVFGSRSIKDTQCGFKLMNRRAAKLLFTNLHIERWAFDVELLKIAEISGIKTSEVAVAWEEIEGSKLNPALDSVKMLKDLFFLWLRYAIGVWKVKSLSKKDD